jgi:drug/metabolite transporter (DMT)-like permease
MGETKQTKVAYLVAIPILIQACITGVLTRKYGRGGGRSVCMPILLSELVKLAISCYFKNPSVKIVYEVLVNAILFSLQNILLWASVQEVCALYFTICYQSRIVFLAILSITLLKKKFNYRQYAGQVLILLGIISISLTKQKGVINYTLRGCAGIVAAGVCTSLSSVYFEMKIRGRMGSVWDYSYVYGLFSVMITLLGLIIEYLVRDMKIAESLLSPELYLSSLCSSLGSMLASYLALKICPMRRTLMAVVISLLATFIIDLTMGVQIGTRDVASFGISYLGTVVYEYRDLLQICRSKETRKEYGK